MAVARAAATPYSCSCGVAVKIFRVKVGRPAGLALGWLCWVGDVNFGSGGYVYGSKVVSLILLKLGYEGGGRENRCLYSLYIHMYVHKGNYLCKVRRCIYLEYVQLHIGIYVNILYVYKSKS